MKQKEQVIQSNFKKPRKAVNNEDVELARVEGSFERHEPRRVRSIHDLLNKKAVEIMCTVEWYPDLDDGGSIPKDSRVPYAEVRKKAPKLLCDFFERHLSLV